MTLEQLTFRRNGYLHDIKDAHHRGVSNSREAHAANLDLQKRLANIESLIGTKIAEAQKNG